MDRVANASVRTKLLAAFLLLGLAPLAFVSLFAYRTASGSLVQAAGARLQDIAFNAIDKLDRNLFERYGDVQAFALSDPAKSMDPERVTAWMDTMMGAYTPIYKLMVVADASGRVVAVNGVDLEGNALPATASLLGRDVGDAAWYRAAMAGQIGAGQSLVDDVHHDDLMADVFGRADGADLAMSFTAPIRDADGNVVGVWTNRFNWDVALTVLSDVEKQAHAGGLGSLRLALVSAEGLALASPVVADVLRQPYATRASVVGAGTSAGGWTEGTALGGAQPVLEAWGRSSGYATYPGVGWTALAAQDADEAVADATSLKWTMLAALAAAASLIATGAWWVAGSIVTRVSRVAVAADGLAMGDLNQRVDSTSTDELGQMARAFATMIEYQRTMAQVAQAMSAGDLSTGVSPKSGEDLLGRAFQDMTHHLRSVIGEVQRSAEGLAVTAERLGLVAQESSHAVGEVATAMQHVATASSDQTRNLEDARGATGQMAEGIGRVQDAVGMVSRASDETRDSARAGAGAVESIVDRMGEIRDVVSAASERVRTLDGLGARIGEVVETINEIADQTNLLALNAAIEAARAGEHGKGFAVVADEVRKLAERSRAETKQIGELIETVQGEMREAATAMGAGASKVGEGAASAEQARVALASIREAAERTAERVHEIAQAARGVASYVEAAQSAIAGAASVSEQNSAAAEEVSASAEQMTANVGQFGHQAGEVAGTAGELRRLMAQFKVS
ncbi:MAG: methyl-accepting chemotaxis protein [Chloroflexota bacterium]